MGAHVDFSHKLHLLGECHGSSALQELEQELADMEAQASAARCPILCQYRVANVGSSMPIQCPYSCKYPVYF